MNQDSTPEKRGIFKSIGPAIIVAAVVLGPGSILTSSKVGATLGLIGFPVVIGAAVLMIAMVALSARLGVVYENSLCDELAARLGRPVAVFIGLTLFTLVAFFQSSNNLAMIGGIEPLFAPASTKAGTDSDDEAKIAASEAETTPDTAASGSGTEEKAPPLETLTFGVRAGILVVANLLIIACLYLLRNLYSSVESLMKLLMGLMTAAFLINFTVVMVQPRTYVPVAPSGPIDLLPLLGMIGTTFSVGGAFYQAYLVKEKGWTLKDARQGVVDSVVSISMLGIVTSIVLLTSWRVFYGNPDAASLNSVGDVAMQLEPSFGPIAKFIFCLGILAGALSSFLVNAMIGGTVMSDSIGLGSRLEDRWPIHLTVIALLVGMSVALVGLRNKDSIVPLITLAQACTVIGLPALAASLIYLATRPDLSGERKVPSIFVALAWVGLLVACVLMLMLGRKVYDKIFPAKVPVAAVAGSLIETDIGDPLVSRIPSGF